MRLSTKLLLIWIILSAGMIGFFGIKWLNYSQPELGFELDVLLVNTTRSNSLYTAANLDKAIEVKFSDSLTDLLNYHVIILNDYELTNESIATIVDFVEAGGGVFIILLGIKQHITLALIC